MSSRKKIPLAIYELPLDKKNGIATTFLTAQILSDVFDETLQRQECSAFKQKLEYRFFEIIKSQLCHNGIISELRVNLILLKMLTAAKKVDSND
jgi:hypothetical protein